MKRALAACVGIMVTAAAAGGVRGAENTADLENFRRIADEYAQITLRMDGESALVDEAYEAVAEYLENQSLDQLEKTAGTVESVFYQLYDGFKELEDYKMPDELFAIIENYDILYEEFNAYASEEKTQIAQYMQDLSGLYEYLSYEATELPMTEDLAFWYETLSEGQELNRKYMYTTINYWFAGRTEEELAYVKEAVIDKLVSFYSDGHEWDNDRASVEDRMLAYQDEMDARLEWAVRLGEREAELNRMKREAETDGTQEE